MTYDGNLDVKMDGGDRPSISINQEFAMTATAEGRLSRNEAAAISTMESIDRSTQKPRAVRIRKLGRAKRNGYIDPSATRLEAAMP